MCTCKAVYSDVKSELDIIIHLTTRTIGIYIQYLWEGSVKVDQRWYDHSRIWYDEDMWEGWIQDGMEVRALD